jgi:hypothetical protein
MRRHRGLLVVVPLALAMAACSSNSGAPTSSTTGSGDRPGVAVLGATGAVWRSGHAQGSGSAGGQGYGPSVSINGHSVDQFTAIQERGGKVTGWHMTFPPGTHLAKAEGLVRAQLPSDVRQTASGRNTFANGGGYCEFVDFQSDKLAAALGTPAPTGSAGNIGVTFYEVTPHGSGTGSIVTVNAADITTGPRAAGRGC